MALANVHYTSSSYIIGALLIIVGVLSPLFHMMQKSRRPMFRSIRRDWFVFIFNITISNPKKNYLFICLLYFKL